MNSVQNEEQKIDTSGSPKGKFSQYSFSSGRRSSIDPSTLISECDNIKTESDRKVVQGFFIDGIKQYYQDKLDRRVSLNSETSKVVLVKETMPEIIISDGECLMYCRIDNPTKKGSEFDLKELKNKYIKLNDWNFTIKMESIVTDNKDFTKILINIKQFQLLEDNTLTCRKTLKFQKLVYEYDSIQNLIKYTKHKLCKNSASTLDPEEIAMPTISDVNNKDNQYMAEIKTVIKVQPDNVKKTVTKIKGFSKPTKIDFDDILGKLPPLKYTECVEVELEEEEPEEDRVLNERLAQIPEGMQLTSILMGLHEDNNEEVVNNTRASAQNSDAEMKDEETKIEQPKEESKTEDEKENKATHDIPDIDGYSQDELEDCIESDTEFHPSKANEVKTKVTPKEVLKSREDILQNIPERANSRTQEKRDKLKEKFTENITKKEWTKFKSWYENESKSCK